MYDRSVPRSNGVALIPSATVSGTLTLDGEEPARVDAWDGMVGHNWGADHADHWTWAHAGGLGPDRSGWFDLVWARIRIGPLLTPWIASGAVHLNGRTDVPARLGRARREADDERTAITVPLAAGGTFELTLHAPRRSTVGWHYESP